MSFRLYFRGLKDSIPHLRRSYTAAVANAVESIVPNDHPSLNDETMAFTNLKNIIHDNTLKALVRKPFNLTTMTPVQAAVLPLLPRLIESYHPESSQRGVHGIHSVHSTLRRLVRQLLIWIAGFSILTLLRRHSMPYPRPPEAPVPRRLQQACG